MKSRPHMTAQILRGGPGIEYSHSVTACDCVLVCICMFVCTCVLVTACDCVLVCTCMFVCTCVLVTACDCVLVCTCMCLARILLASSMKGVFSLSDRIFHSEPSRFEISELCILGFSWTKQNIKRLNRFLSQPEQSASSSSWTRP